MADKPSKPLLGEIMESVLNSLAKSSNFTAEHIENLRTLHENGKLDSAADVSTTLKLRAEDDENN